MADRKTPDCGLAKNCLPAPLYRAIQHVFSKSQSAMLVGGTALAGYYAGHRRSDDMDLFTPNERAQKAVTLATKSLQTLGAKLFEEVTEAYMYHSAWELEGHRFTAQVVLDPRIHEIGHCIKAEDGVRVADLRTILKMKSATLLSRCSEKDLFDLLWLFAEFDGEYTVKDIVELAHDYDGGANAEAMFISVAGTKLSKESCDFGVQENAEEIFALIERFRKKLAGSLRDVAKNIEPPELAKLISVLKSHRKMRK